MKILLSYSFLHFDPFKPVIDHKYWGSSASILARILYTLLKEFGSVTYIDAFSYKPPSEPKHYDLFIGIDHNFFKILSTNKIKKSIYFAVNMHPIERNKILKQFVEENGLSEKVYSGWDRKSISDTEKSLSMTNYILCTGNIQTYNSYIRHGIPKSKIKILNYGIPDDFKLITPSVKKSSNSINFVYASSEIGLRKGFDIVYSIFTHPKIRDNNFCLHVVGNPSNDYYKNKLNSLQQILGKKVKYYGWLKADSVMYHKTLQKNDFIVFPSLEEGQTGTVLDCLQYGVIPVITLNSGIDFSPMGVLETKMLSEHNISILKNIFLLSKEKIKYYRKNALDYYQEFHSNFEIKIKDTIKSCIKDELYPKVSIILPIFNKEKTIKHLVTLLDKVCQEYENVELHIIFDGCKDKTEKAVQDFYRRRKAYRVTYQRTPNIFEIKTNNLGLKKSKGKYCIILQDDNYIYDRNLLFEIVSFMDKNNKAVIVGCLAGVNYYPRNIKNLNGKGQIVISRNEAYWRQDENTDAVLKNKIFEVDACMRGPLVIRKSFLEKYGYLDETYAPLHQDDMDICFRARSLGYRVYCFLSDVENKSMTVNTYDPSMTKYWTNIYKRNTDIFYSRWHPSRKKDYLWVWRILIYRTFQETMDIYFIKLKESIQEYLKNKLDRLYVKVKQYIS